MITPEEVRAYQIVLKYISDKKEETTEAIAVSEAKDFASYRHITGIIKGLYGVENYIKELMNPSNDND